MIRATLDTNAVVSGLLGLRVPTSTPGTIIRYWLDGEFELVISAAILAEIENTLDKPFFRARRSEAGLDAAFAAIVQVVTVVDLITNVSGVATHPEDDVILSTAVSAGVDFLVTGDKMLQQVGAYQGIYLVSPREFLDVLEANARSQTPSS